MASSDQQQTAELTIMIVSYNTRALTLACLHSLFSHPTKARFQVVLIDNASSDGSAAAISAAYPQVKVIASDRNLGFAAANNLLAAQATTEWLLLLNPDTEVEPGAIDNLLDFSKNRPQAGITGGRTVFPDGTLNPSSCWMAMTLWSTLCLGTGLTAAFRSTSFFNPEGIGSWKRDSVREVDIVSGCFFMIRRELWNELGGFNPKYFMYGEEADLCLRAKALGYRPAITPDAQIMHLVGASAASTAEKVIRVLKARATLIRDHWPATNVRFGLFMLWLWVALRVAAYSTLHFAKGAQSDPAKCRTWQLAWKNRSDWLNGF